MNTHKDALRSTQILNMYDLWIDYFYLQFHTLEKHQSDMYRFLTLSLFYSGTIFFILLLV